MYLLEGAGLFAHRHGKGVEPDRTTTESVHDGLEDPLVHFIQPVAVDIEHGQRGRG